MWVGNFGRKHCTQTYDNQWKCNIFLILYLFLNGERILSMVKMKFTLNRMRTIVWPGQQVPILNTKPTLLKTGNMGSWRLQASQLSCMCCKASIPDQPEPRRVSWATLLTRPYHLMGHNTNSGTVDCVKATTHCQNEVWTVKAWTFCVFHLSTANSMPSQRDYSEVFILKNMVVIWTKWTCEGGPVLFCCGVVFHERTVVVVVDQHGLRERRTVGQSPKTARETPLSQAPTKLCVNSWGQPCC